jgi:tripartite-type tricarboxylate transporter receptor subunit TctC
LRCFRWRAAKVRALAITSARRSALAPDIPTAGESGMAGLEFASWYGMWGPKSLAPQAVSWLNRAVNEATTALAATGRFAQLGQEPVQETPEDFARYIDRDMARTAGLLQKSKFQPL